MKRTKWSLSDKLALNILLRKIEVSVEVEMRVKPLCQIISYIIYYFVINCNKL